MTDESRKPAFYGPLRVSPISGAEAIVRGGVAVGPTVLDFWRWSGADLTGNGFRLPKRNVAGSRSFSRSIFL